MEKEDRQAAIVLFFGLAVEPSEVADGNFFCGDRHGLIGPHNSEVKISLWHTPRLKQSPLDEAR